MTPAEQRLTQPEPGRPPARDSALARALDDPTDLSLRPLPGRVEDLLISLDCPARLAAHLRLVHDVACQILDWIGQRHPHLDIDRHAVLFGAATHDIGKTLHPDELSGPGSAHETAGRDLLLRHGVDEALARFAATHASWADADISLEDLLVSLADKVWKNKRVPDLEDRVVAHLAQATGRPLWEEYAALDEFLTRIGDDADERLAVQAAYPVRG
ncbi:MAG TPA: HD domain-containing protein [Spirillospora sp.]